MYFLLYSLLIFEKKYFSIFTFLFSILLILMIVIAFDYGGDVDVF